MLLFYRALFTILQFTLERGNKRVANVDWLHFSQNVLLLWKLESMRARMESGNKKAHWVRTGYVYIHVHQRTCIYPLLILIYNFKSILLKTALCSTGGPCL